MQTVTVKLMLSPQHFQAYYQGLVDDMVARATDGRIVQFPARVLRPFLTYRGIEGTFEITFDANLRFQSIRQVEHDR